MVNRPHDNATATPVSCTIDGFHRNTEARCPTIRPSTPADATVLADIWRASVRATHDFLSADHFTEIEALVAHQYLPRAPLWVIEVDGRPASWA